MRLEDVGIGMRLAGATSDPVTVKGVQLLGSDLLEVTYRSDDGTLGEQILTRDHERVLRDLAATTWTFDADAAEFALAAEAMRMRMAGLFDPMLAVTTSNVEPLPHQIRAVYGEMLPKPGPLRFLLADDPGAGKTIMAGLYLKELLLRGDVARCLIVAPGGLVDQWQEELKEKFDLTFAILTRDLAEACPDGDPFRTHPLLIARMDQLSRDEVWLAHLGSSEWDLVVVDEAHRMSATYTGQELSRTLRYQLGQELGRVARHLLLMTATPHAGKDEDFQAFLALLDPDRFEGAYRRGVHRADYDGLMRRMIKEDLLTFEGRALFPERIAQTVPYELSAGEQTLYEQVTAYVRDQMNLADRVAADGDNRRRTTVGFALTVLQRRLASSPEAIYQSLLRRTARLQTRRQEITQQLSPLEHGLDQHLAQRDLERITTVLGDPDEIDAGDAELLEDEVLDAATAARTVGELDIELAVLAELSALAGEVRSSQLDRKWTELRSLILEAQRSSRDGQPAKVIVFTEHRDTLRYLQQRISTLLGQTEAVVTIDGGTRRQDRLAVRDRFTHDPTCAVLVATDAAGEGLNLQAAHLMVNYDLPWNPNRIEQRFGRIHRIGQREVCRLWNLVASNTREGQVFERLLTKIEEQRRAYGGKVFDVLGEHAFGEQPLRNLLMEAVRYGDDPIVKARLDEVIDAGVSRGLTELVRERALATPEIALEDLFRLRREMDEAKARRLQPHYVGRFFVAAFRAAGGSLNRREQDRFEITHVPAALRAPRVTARYERVCFEPARVTLPDGVRAELLAPGHPLFDALVSATLDRAGQALTRGAVFLDPDDQAVPRVIVTVQEEIVDGEGSVVSQRCSFVDLTEDGATLAGPAPYLDLVPPGLATTELVGGVVDGDAVARQREAILGEAWLESGVSARATTWAVADGLPAHRDEVEQRLSVIANRTAGLVRARLNSQINHWYAEATRLAEDQAAGRKIRLAPATALQRAGDLEARLQARLGRLAAQGRIEVRPPRVIGAALAVPARGVLGPPGVATALGPIDTTVSERRAVDAVLAAERRLGRVPEEMPHNNPGYDVLSTRQDGSTLRIEVKGRVLGATDFVVTAQEVLTGLNAGDDYFLALVAIDPEGKPGEDEVRYLVRPFDSLTIDQQLEASKRLRWRPMWELGGLPR